MQKTLRYLGLKLPCWESRGHLPYIWPDKLVVPLLMQQVSLPIMRLAMSPLMPQTALKVPLVAL